MNSGSRAIEDMSQFSVNGCFRETAQLPDDNLAVFWSAFTIYLHQPGVPAPGAEICRWPEPE